MSEIEYSNPISSLIFSKSQLFSFFLTCNLIGVPYGHDFFLPTQRAMLGGPFKYLEHVRKANRNFPEAFEKIFQLQKWGVVRIFQPDFELHIFKISTFSTFPDI